MSSSTTHRRAFAVPIALALSLLLANQAMATTWSEPITLHSFGETSASPGGLVTVGSSKVVVVYRESDPSTGIARIFIRRSIDGGSTWAPRVRVSRTGSDYTSWDPAIGAHGNNIDVVWADYDPITEAGQIRYSRSTDGGASFSQSVALSSLGNVAYPNVARGSSGRVAVSWSNFATGKVLLRLSADGGETFAPRHVLWASVYPYRSAVAVGEGVIYAAYASPDDGIRLRRSIDGGETWRSSAQLGGARAGMQPISLTAEGGIAYLGFLRKASDGWTPSYRRTTDKGTTWASRVKLGRPSLEERALIIKLKGGVSRAAISRCNAGTGECAVFYRENADGISWTPRERVSPAGWAYPFGVGFAGKIVVGYVHASRDTDERIQVRTGTP